MSFPLEDRVNYTPMITPNNILPQIVKAKLWCNKTTSFETIVLLFRLSWYTTPPIKSAENVDNQY